MITTLRMTKHETERGKMAEEWDIVEYQQELKMAEYFDIFL